MNQEKEYSVKILVLGVSGVGKTSIVLRFTDDVFTANHLRTIGIDFKNKIVSLDSKSVTIKIMDTGGQEKFHDFSSKFCSSNLTSIFRNHAYLLDY